MQNYAYTQRCEKKKLKVGCLRNDSVKITNNLRDYIYMYYNSDKKFQIFHFCQKFRRRNIIQISYLHINREEKIKKNETAACVYRYEIADSLAFLLNSKTNPTSWDCGAHAAPSRAQEDCRND